MLISANKPGRDVSMLDWCRRMTTISAHCNITCRNNSRVDMRERDTWETNPQCVCPLPKNLVQLILRAGIFNHPLQSVMNMPLVRVPEMAEVVVSMFAAELEGSQKELPPTKFIFANLMDLLACEGLSQNLPHNLRDMGAIEASRNVVPRLLHQAATAMEKTGKLLRNQLNTPAILPPGMIYWGRALQQFVYLLTEVSSANRLLKLCIQLARLDGRLASGRALGSCLPCAV